MTHELVSVVDLASQLGRRRQTIFKVISRLRLKTTKRRGSDSRGQLIAFVTPDDAQAIRNALSRATDSPDAASDDVVAISDAENGVFYLLALEPKHDPGRFKVGFAISLSERLQKHRCSAPLLEVVGYWPCKRLWERTAMDAVAYDCERMHTEVFRCNNIATIKQRCESFFALMPKPSDNDPGTENVA